MSERVDYYISGIRKRGEHITHLRVHKALADNSFAPHGIVQPRSMAVVNMMSKSMVYKVLHQENGRVRPGEVVHLVELGNRFYLKTSSEGAPQDDLGGLPSF